ncbi:MAG: hypothetical protein CFE23_11915 [Flavobacterium sp. BFFFF1]|uniref:hypothetical protein n=1 Tax=Flavobacterium sp. BFFFF1 TaxID=2015557 RepID=UPI000BD5A573|nr:hypothetical protein [Flavobacterium sp. BFFFF1]OYU79954.1 MAG: hypothetical protein CFE23_11915 [Flavobacterium sp. BFFFF1]
MRKSIIMMCICLSVLGCRENVKTTKATFEETETKTNVSAKITRKNNTIPAPIILVVNLQRIPAGTRRNDWIDKYGHYCVEATLNDVPNNNCGSGRKYFCLSNFSTDKVIQATWIRENRDYLCYIESKYYIENSHALLLDEEGMERANTLIYRPKSLNEIKRIIELSGGSYEEDKYDRYLSVNLSDDPSNLIVAKKEFVSEGTCYSLQNFKSIVEVNRISGNPIFEFTVFNDEESGNAYPFFRVRPNNGPLLYYDFSDNPTLLLNLLKKK